MQRAFHWKKNQLDKLGSDIRSSRCKNFSLKQASGLTWGAGCEPLGTLPLDPPLHWETEPNPSWLCEKPRYIYHVRYQLQQALFSFVSAFVVWPRRGKLRMMKVDYWKITRYQFSRKKNIFLEWVLGKNIYQVIIKNNLEIMFSKNGKVEEIIKLFSTVTANCDVFQTKKILRKRKASVLKEVLFFYNEPMCQNVGSLFIFQFHLHTEIVWNNTKSV